MQWKGNKLLSETKKNLNKSLHTEVKTTVKYQKKKKKNWEQNSNKKIKQGFITRTTMFITVNVSIKYAMKNKSAKMIAKLRKELSTTTNVRKIPIF